VGKKSAWPRSEKEKDMENKKRLFVAAVIAIVLASAGTTFAMGDHWITGWADNGMVGCQASIDNMTLPPGAGSGYHYIWVYLYAPSGQLLSATGHGIDDIFLMATTSHTSVGSGTYHCHATYHEEYSEGGYGVSEDDSLDEYFEG